MELLLATGNTHKAQELRDMLSELPVTVLTPDEIGGLPEVIEDGTTFGENAVKKARSAALHTGRWSLADDSGLCVDALGGAPGIHSARYGGTHGDDQGNNHKLLKELAQVPERNRNAAFVCALALARPNGEIETVLEGRTEGRILNQAEGQGGFGYDPLFQFIEPNLMQTNRCFASLTSTEKSAVSHRGRALRALGHELIAILERSP
ncbi:MAG: non-canonical purine NTP pyrophosphatase, RdgB/HAM1 family [Planctomycetes bacterium]|nr:non-canonical purine NTP pyrophosphatase, RdgB/HAM1 family [Planctomycetota bacterium]